VSCPAAAGRRPFAVHWVDLVPAGLAFCDLASKELECFDKELADEMRLQLACFSLLHTGADALDVGGAHRLGQASLRSRRSNT
jgi:hypothetical protein